MGFKRWLPISAGVVTVIATLIMWRSLRVHERDGIDRMVLLKAQDTKRDIELSIEAQVLALVRMARRWELRGKPPRDEWETDAGLYVKHYVGYQALIWVDPSMRARWIVPLKGNELYQGNDLSGDAGLRNALSSAKGFKEARLSYAIKNDVNLLVAAVPIFLGDKPGGFIIGIFRRDELLSSILNDADLLDYSFRIYKDGQVIYERNNGDMAFEKKWGHKGFVNLYGDRWTLNMWPTVKRLRAMRSHLSEGVLMTGFMMATALATAIFFAQTAVKRRKESEKFNLELKKEIDDRKQAERDVERYASELKRSNASLEQFAYVASHDLQEPLRIISAYVQLISKRYKGSLDKDADEFISYVVDGVSRMKDLIQDILVYSRLGSVEKQMMTTDCEKVLESAIANLQARIMESNAVITHDPLPVITADEPQIGQVFQNLIGNAIKYRREAAPRVHISAESKPEEWLFSVRDNGLGIDPKFSERIFVIFQRLHGEKYPGTGIGLSICRKAVENHGGRIWVESRPGEGSIFYFTIPVKAG